MAKRRKIKKSVFLVGGIILFFGVYIGSFMLFSKVENSDKKNAVTINTEREDNRSLLKQLEDKEKIYLSDGVVSDVRVDDKLLEELRYSFEDVSKIRTPQSYTSVYEGYSDDGLKFSTDLNVIRIYTVNKEEDVYKRQPLDRLFIKTDSPYMAPTPHRGKRNDPSLVQFVADTIAVEKGVSYETVCKATKENAKRFFGIE